MPATGVRIPQRGQPHSQSSLRNAQLRVDISGAIVAPTAANDGAALRLVTRMQSSLLSGTIVQHHPGQRPPSQLRPLPSTLLGRKPAVPLVIAPFSEERLRELIPSPTVGTVAELAPIAHPLHSSSSGPLLPAAHRQQLNSMPALRPSPAADHDRAVALVSHAPQLVASLMAARLIGANGVELAGQGLRDTVRIAASDPKLWTQILGANAPEVLSVLTSFETDLAQVIEALRDVGKPGALATLDQTIANGNRGVEALPGKHGSRLPRFNSYVVMIDDRPGELARLFNEIGDAGINVEDLKLEHSPGAQIGLVEVSVLPSVGEKLVSELTNRGWRFA